MPPGPLHDRIAVITGASAGIGEAAARALAGAGARVVLNARRADRLDALANELGGPSRAAAAPGDAADPGVIRSMLDAARDRFGNGTREADLVLVNAGRGLRGSVYTSDQTRWEEVIRTNLTAAASLMRAAAERMAGPVEVVAGPPKDGPPPQPPPGWLDRPRDIVVLGSTVGRHVSPFSSMYGSTKAAVHMLAESLRRTLAPRGIRVSLLEPGVVRSEFQAQAGYDPQSFGQFMDSISPVLTPEDVARIIVFMVGQPAGVHINDMMIRPTRQEYP
ncbi:MAG: SDR family NAD(P)-dependent oxidoreductase [Phycisphaerales bacterium]